MDASFFLKGFIIGFSIAAPVGPIGILCIRRTLASGMPTGLLSGLGAATADAFYGSIAAFGLTFLSSLLLQEQTWLRLVGGAFLCFLGLRTMLSKPVDGSTRGSSISLLNAYGSTFLLTLTNPLTILSFVAIFAGFGLATVKNSYPSAGLMVVGVFLGSSSWWLILSSLTGWLKSRLNLDALTWINRLSGLILLGFGLASIIGIWLRV